MDKTAERGDAGTPARGMLAGLGGWIALASSFLALAQGATSWINGYWQAQAEQQKARQELALTEIKERSALASEYLKLIIAKDTAPTEKVTLLDALGSIEKHPLQQWARERHKLYLDLLARSEAAFQAQRRAAEEKEGAERQEAELRAEIERLTAEAELVRDDTAKREVFRKEILAKAGTLAEVSARVSLTRLTFQGRQSDYAAVQQRISVTQAVLPPAAVTASRPAPAPASVPANGATGPNGAPSAASVETAYGAVNAITEISEKITQAMLGAVFPASARPNIDAATPYLRAALQEFQVTDRRMIAAIIATIAVETPRFETYEEPATQAARHEGNERLGNTQPGDGIRFRGRGYVGLTGRANYTLMSQKLGLGSRLVTSPEDAATPEIACRILVAWMVTRDPKLPSALEAGNLGAARRVVSGSPTSQIERFTTVYQQVLATL